jgi:hypothetical protein
MFCYPAAPRHQYQWIGYSYSVYEYMHAVLTRVDVFSCHVSCCVVGKIRREEHILVRNFYTVRVETHTGREMMVGGWQVIIRWNFHLQFEVAQKLTVVLNKLIQPY